MLTSGKGLFGGNTFIVRIHFLCAFKQLCKDAVLLLVGGFIGLVMCLQYQLACVSHLVQDLKEFFPVDVAVAGDEVLVTVAGAV